MASLVVICGVGLVLRLLVVWACATTPIVADMQAYHDSAVYILQNGRLVPEAYRAPGYPLFLAGIYSLFGISFAPARFVQAVIGTATIPLTYALARRFSRRPGALMAAALVGVYPAWLIYPVYLIAENAFTFLTLLGLWLWPAAGDGRAFSRRAWLRPAAAAALAGLALGAAALQRGVGIATLAGITAAHLLWIVPALRARMKLLLLLVAFWLGVALPFAPWVARNYERYGRFVPLETSSGYNFLIGNNPRATGRLVIEDVDAIIKEYLSTAREDAHMSELAYRAGWTFIKTNPGKTVELAFHKIGFLLGLEGREHAWTYGMHLQGARAPATVWLWGIAIIASFPFVMLPALAGLLRPGLWRSPWGLAVTLILLAVVGAHVSSFGESRFHMPWVPLLAVAATRVVSPLEETKWTKPRGALFIVLAAALCVLWASQAPGLFRQLLVLASSPGPANLPY